MIDTALRLCKPCKAGALLLAATQAGACAERGVSEGRNCALQMLIFMTAELQIRQDGAFLFFTLT
jgi:hypothetical protein